jgi:hypothetical protein
MKFIHLSDLGNFYSLERAERFDRMLAVELTQGGDIQGG